VTNRRSYAFRLSYSDTHDARALYKLVIRYPDSAAKQAQAAREESAIRTAFAQSGTPINWRSYTQSGDRTLAPVHAWDDGRQTWLQFPRQADIPAVYRVTPEGQEVITNFHMADDRTMVLHRTAAKWHLRLGNEVLAIHNEDYGKTEAPSHTGTVSPNVVRVVNGAQQTKALILNVDRLILGIRVKVRLEGHGLSYGSRDCSPRLSHWGLCTTAMDPAKRP